MSPINYFPTARDIVSDIASASVTSSAVPSPTPSTSTNIAGNISKVMPAWVAYLFPILFFVLFALWWAWRRPYDTSPDFFQIYANYKKAVNDKAAPMPQPTIVEPAPAYTAAAKNAAPGSEDVPSRQTACNTLQNQRRSAQVFEKPLVTEAPLPPILRPEGARLLERKLGVPQCSRKILLSGEWHMETNLKNIIPPNCSVTEPEFAVRERKLGVYLQTTVHVLLPLGGNLWYRSRERKFGFRDHLSISVIPLRHGASPPCSPPSERREIKFGAHDCPRSIIGLHRPHLSASEGAESENKKENSAPEVNPLSSFTADL
ncbi:hypothetical protein DFH07DRAFT_765826 [Mycena maculata]|uniref:Uncharacterized protein n=1 Tax=Mycena maculata TaxID=230809 RepID=A0AAD7NWY3_9AGAR|nr:hypothetical protein DFH07DRAFT_765826 [Mycena maculata]